MSGGSYNYLCFKDPEDLFGETHDSGDLARMADALAELGYADDAAKATTEVLLTVRKMKTRLQVMVDDLELVWRAMEWWHSADSNEDEFKKVLDEWRAPTPGEEE